MNPEEHPPSNNSSNTNSENNKENSKGNVEQKVRKKLSKIRPYNKNKKQDNKSLWRYALYGVQSIYESAKHLNDDENLKGRFRLHRNSDEKVIICLEKSQRPSYLEARVPGGLGIFTDGAGESDSENYFSAEMEFQQIEKIYSEKLQVQTKYIEKEAELQTEIAQLRANCETQQAKTSFYKSKYEKLKGQLQDKLLGKAKKLISKPQKPIRPKYTPQNVFNYPATRATKTNSCIDTKKQTKPKEIKIK